MVTNETGLNEMRCALVALVGVPNAGKSTLMNAIVGEKVGIISSKPNTTRVTVRGVKTSGVTQLIFMDTPGLNKSSKSFDRRLVQQAEGAWQEADVVVYLCDASKLRGDAVMALREHKEMLDRHRHGENQKVVVVLTKVDMVKDKKLLLPLLTEINGWGVDAVVPLAAMKDNGVSQLLRELERMAVAGPWLFPAEQVTDMPMALRLAEITREKAMQLLHEEVPYGVGVLTQSMEEGDAEGEAAPWLIKQQILVARDQHKGMVLGKGGQMLKMIGTKARMDMQEILGAGVRLELHVKVAEKWLEREDWLREMGV